jgi:hypothetical protein
VVLRAFLSLRQTTHELSLIAADVVDVDFVEAEACVVLDAVASKDQPALLLPPVRSTLPSMTSTSQPRVALLTGDLGGARLATFLRDALG